MPTITIPASYLDTLRRVAMASGCEKTSPTLMAVSVSILPGGKIRTGATDCKILADHAMDAPDTTGWPLDRVDLMLPWHADKGLASWVKDNAKLAAKGKPTDTLSIAWEGRDITLTYKGSGYRTKCVEGTFTSYANALDQSSAVPATVALSGDYLATMNAILHQGGARSAVKIRKGRGWVFERMNGDADLRVLIMPLTLPQAADAQADMVEVHRTRLTELEGYEATIRSGQAPAAPDPAIVAENEKLHARIADLESHVITLGERLSQANAPAPVECHVTKWRPIPTIPQRHQLKAAGLDVDDLRRAGFRWIICEWVSELPEAIPVLAKIRAANP